VSGPYRDVSAERRDRAAACVERHLAGLRATLDAAGLPCPLVEGSAVAAEVFIAQSNTLHTVVRVALRVDKRRRRAIDRTLRGAGYERSEPMRDGTLLRMATQHGHGAIHVLFDGEDAAGANGHPGSRAAARARAVRIGSALVDVEAAYRRSEHEAAADHDVTETFEVQIVDA
jgi:hypothetical protein